MVEGNVFRVLAVVLTIALQLPTLAQAQAPSGASAPAAPSTPSASASDSAAEREARALFEAGNAAYEAGRYQDALERFRAAYEHHPHPALMYNVGQAADRLRRDDEALAAFEIFLRDSSPDMPHRVEVEHRVAVLRDLIAERDRQRASEARANAALDPAAVARAEAASPTRDAPQAKPITKKWWFWTSIAGVVALAVVLPVVLTRDGGASANLPTGDVGGTIFTLRSPR